MTILDEVNIIIHQISSDINARESENAICIVLRSVRYILAIDAFANTLILTFLQVYRDKNIHIVDNKYQPHIGKTVEFIYDPNSGAEVMQIRYDLLKQGKCIVFVSTGAEDTCFKAKNNFEKSVAEDLHKSYSANHWKVIRELFQVLGFTGIDDSGLEEIHQKNLVYCDFHHGNILNIRNNNFSISDLGLCKSVEYFQSSKNNDIYGVLPFLAPEILTKEQTYTLASDIYSFSMIMWEFIFGVPPFNDKVYSLNLIIQIYQDLMKKCWDSDPLKRPTATEIKNTFEV
ncbi:13043_t:CDS:2 [Funneliformis geosporum]|nr:13043_t:CDS:2 [Funneliformis geosporum]